VGDVQVRGEGKLLRRRGDEGREEDEATRGTKTRGRQLEY